MCAASKIARFLRLFDAAWLGPGSSELQCLAESRMQDLRYTLSNLKQPALKALMCGGIPSTRPSQNEPSMDACWQRLTSKWAPATPEAIRLGFRI